MHTPSRPIAYLCLALSMSLVGSYVALSKPLAAIFPVMLLAWLRFGIGAVAMLGWLRPPAHETTLTRQTKWLLFFESFFGNFLFTLCMISGVALTSAVTAGVTMAAIPAAVAIMSWLFLREAVGARTWTAIAFAVAGIGLNALSKTESSSLAAHPQQGLGQLLLIAAVLCEAAYAVIGKKLTASVSPKRITALINLWGFVLSTPAGLYLAWQFDFSRVSVPAWGLLLFYALAACVWTVWLCMTRVRAVPTTRAGILTVMLLFTALVVGMLGLGGRVGSMQLLAFGIALTSVVIATWPGTLQIRR